MPWVHGSGIRRPESEDPFESKSACGGCPQSAKKREFEKGLPEIERCFHAQNKKEGGVRMNPFSEFFNPLNFSVGGAGLDSCRIPFIFKSGGDGPGLGCRETDTVVARALPEFATGQVVICRRMSPDHDSSANRQQPSKLPALTSTGRNRPSRTVPSTYLTWRCFE